MKTPEEIAAGVEATEFWRADHPASICSSVLWDSIHGQEAWNANPWVAAIRFRVVTANIDSLPAKAA